jgi:hypothetical protein
MLQRPDHQPEQRAKKAAVISLEVCRGRNLDRGRRIPRRGVTASSAPDLPTSSNEKVTMPKARHVKANTSNRPAPNTVATSEKDDVWSWVIIAVIFVISATAIWAPIILGGA